MNFWSRFRKRQNRVDFRFDEIPGFVGIHAPSHRVKRPLILTSGLAVILPCLLIGSAVADVQPKFLDGGTLGREQASQIVAERGRVESSMVTSEINLCKGGGECFMQPRAGSSPHHENSVVAHRDSRNEATNDGADYHGENIHKKFGKHGYNEDPWSVLGWSIISVVGFAIGYLFGFVGVLRSWEWVEGRRGSGDFPSLS